MGSFEEKYDRRLIDLLETERSRASLGGEPVESVDNKAFEVLVVHQERLTAPDDVDMEQRGEAVAELAGKVRESQAPVLALLEGVGAGREPTVHRLVNAVTATLTPPQISALAELDEVASIRSEEPEVVLCMNESVHVIEAPPTWRQLHLNGHDIRVALLDTGADKNHPALAGKIVSEVSTVPTEAVTVPGAHATHTAGTILSQDPVYRGVAYGAELVNIKVLTAFGSGQPSWVIQGLAEAVLRRAHVASMSLGWSELWGWVCNDGDCPLCQAADNVVRLGVSLIVAAGNEGPSSGAPPFTVRHPGAARLVTTVGAVDKAKVLAGFSSTGPASPRLSPSSTIRWTKPNVCGPGVNIVSCRLGGGFQSMSGTSMATPHVAGIAALLHQKHHGLSPAKTRKLLEDTCQPLRYGPNEQGYGLVSAFGAVLR